MILNEIDLASFVLFAKMHGQLMKLQFPSLISVIYVVSRTYTIYGEFNYNFEGLSVHTGCRFMAKCCYPCDDSMTHQKLTTLDLQNVNTCGNLRYFLYLIINSWVSRASARKSDSCI